MTFWLKIEYVYLCVPFKHEAKKKNLMGSFRTNKFNVTKIFLLSF